MLRRIGFCLVVLVSILGAAHAWWHGINITAVITDGENAVVGFNSGFYDATSNTTWLCWSSSVSTTRYISAKTYSHSTNSWSAEETVGINYNGDQHGWPSCLMDQYGFVHYFCCSHNGPLYYTYTNVARSVTGGFANFSTIGVEQTFSVPTLVNGVVYVFSSVSGDGTQALGIIYGTPSPSGGISSWSSPTKLVEFSDFTFYGNAVVNGTKICIPFTYSPNTSFEQDTYYGCYNTTDGSFSNIGGTTVVPAGSLPISLTTAQADFAVNLTNSPSINNGNIWPVQVVDNSGTVHVFFVSSTATGSTPIYESHWNGSSWTNPTSTGAMQAGYTPIPAGFATSDGGYDLYYSPDLVSINRLHWTSSGGFGPSSKIITSSQSQSQYEFISLVSVVNGLPSFPVLLGESAGELGQGAYGDVKVFTVGP